MFLTTELEWLELSAFHEIINIRPEYVTSTVVCVCICVCKRKNSIARQLIVFRGQTYNFPCIVVFCGLK